FLFYLLASSFFAIAYSHRSYYTLAKKNSTSKKTNQTKFIIKPSSKNNQTKLIQSSNSSQKNQTKHISSPKNTTKLTSKNVGASLNSTKQSTKSLDPLKSTSSSKNKTKSSSNTITKLPSSDTKINNKVKPHIKDSIPQSSSILWQDSIDEEDYDFMAEIRDLPSKFHQSFVPDIHKLSTTSKMYLTKANKQITNNFIKPYVGNQYASSISTAISCAFIIVPFLLVSLLFNQITAYFSLQKLVIFTQIYLSIYFSILCLSSLITGLEPLRFFYATSQSTYVWLQVLQTLGYVMYLLMLLMYLILVFSTDSGLGQKFLGLAQTIVGFAVGLHYYVTVFHRVLLRQPPKTNWKVHGIYATCFLVICLLARVERRKKAYPEEGGEEGKQS
ncbi:Glycerol-3-phosphate dehydrogenase [NAD(P)+], partial [Bienertia sinuspersici]